MITTIFKGCLFSLCVTSMLLCGWNKLQKALASFTKKQKCTFWMLVFYTILVIYMTLLTYTYDPIISEVGFTPFHTFVEIYRYGIRDMGWQLIFNILMFVPFGLFLPNLFDKMRSYSMMFTVGFISSLFIECTQVLVGRSFDFDDILCNSLGALLGLGLYFSLSTILKHHRCQEIERKDKVTVALTFAQLFLVLLYPATLIF